MEPLDAPIPEAPPNTRCVSCEAPLGPGQRLRCLPCVASAEIAVKKAGDAVVRPSDVARVRGRL